MTAPATRTLFAFLIVLFFLAPSPAVLAHVREVRDLPQDYSIEILVDGVPLARHLNRGRTYVEALPGREYSIRLRNNTDRRVAIALSVDGLNTIDAKTSTARAASKWILDPWQEITLDGWQTSASTARRFYFTTEESSYGAWLGKTSNLGVVTAAVFREKRQKPAPIQKGGAKEQGKMRSEPKARPEPSSDAAAAPAPSRDAAEARPQSGLSDDLAATGIGQEVGHDVVRVPFIAESAPAATLEVRYEYRDALIRLGVLRQPDPPCDALCRRERARGFDGMEFAPDPYR